MATLTMKEQLAYLKGMTLRLGSIHEAQALQLKLWPRLVPGIESSEAHVDTEKQSVRFVCGGKKFKKTKKVAEILVNIDRWVKMLLWDSTFVVFEVNGKEIFRGNLDAKKKETEADSHSG